MGKTRSAESVGATTYTGVVERTGALLSRERTGEGCRIRVGPETFAGVVVPRTREVTTLSEKCVGDLIHFETDLLATYVERQRSLAGSA